MNDKTDQVIYDDVFQELIDQFCIDNDIPDMRTAPQSVWNSCLRYIYKNVFKGKDLLKTKELHLDINKVAPSNDNAYDPVIVAELLDVYIYDMCMKYDKEISIIGFSAFSGIDDNTLHAWGNNSGRDELSKSRKDIYKKLYHFREESLSNKLVTGNKNPVGLIAMLNRHYGWASPYVADSNKQRQALTAADLPRLGGSGTVPAAQIEGNVSE